MEREKELHALNLFKRLFVFYALLLMMLVFVPLNVYADYTERINAFDYAGYHIPAYDGDPYEVINDNNPKFQYVELNQNIYEQYGALDSFGRVTTCSANIDQSLMPTGSRGSISSIYPTGWIQAKYSFVNGGYLYNRCHLIGWQLTAEDANKYNLMTGTRSFNVGDGMLKFENMVATYIRKDPENNVLYRITPVFQGDNLLATGIIMEAESVDDNGLSIKYCVFVYNVEPGVAIDYATGANKAADSVNEDGTNQGGNNEGGNTVKEEEPITQSAIDSVSVKSTLTYTGKYLKPSVTVKSGGKTLKLGTDYTAFYNNNKYVGKATVTITGKGNYKGTKKISFNIIPKAPTILSLAPGKRSITVKIRRQQVQTTGYQIQYSTKKSFASAKSKNVKAVTSKVPLKSLNANKKYYVRIRSYKTVGGKKYYSTWSAVKYKKTR